jgi:hypothetical protein
MAFFQKITGTSVGKFIIGLTGVSLKNNSGSLDVRNNADTAFTDVNAAQVSVNGTTYKTTLISSASQATDLSITFPSTAGTNGFVLQTDGAGVTTWASAATTGDKTTVDTTTLNFGSSSTVSCFTLPAGALVLRSTFVVDTAFDGTPSMSVGITGNASKYFGSGDLLLGSVGSYQVPFYELPDVSSEAIEITYSAGSATVGTGRLLVEYVVSAA